jgi:hypothetical protein
MRYLGVLLAVLLGLAAGCSRTSGSGGTVEALDAIAGEGSGEVFEDASADAAESAGESSGADADSESTTTPPAGDQDQDGIPDAADPFPTDPAMPGTARDNVVYAHTEDELWTLSVKTYALDFACFFDWPADDNPHKMTDLAIDRWGVLYGVSFKGLYVCHPTTCACSRVGDLPDGFNALTMVPAGVLDPERDVLVGISGGGGWYRLDAQGQAFQATQLGSYGPGYSSSGDAYAIKDVGAFATVNKGTEIDDWLVEVDPATGAVIREVAQLDGLRNVYGLAGWTDRAMAFDEGGTIVVIETATGSVIKVLEDTPKKWWGAGVRTSLP